LAALALVASVPPMASLSEAQVGQVLGAYGLPPGTPVGVLGDGNNLILRLGLDPVRVLRVHRPRFRDPRHTRAELSFQRYLARRLPDIAIPVPIPTTCGDLVVKLDDGRHCDLQTWIGGRPRSPEDGLDERAARLLGQTLARLHDAAAEFTPAEDFLLPHWDGDGLFRAEASPFRPLLRLDEILDPEDRRDFAEVEHRTREVFAELDQHPGTYGIIHVDFILGNVHLSRVDDDWRVGVIDFDDCGYGYFLYDLGPVLGNLIKHPGLQQNLIDGYDEVRPLPEHWRRQLSIMIAARHAAMCYWTAGYRVSPTPREDARWRMDLARAAIAS
jgi:Ser/Thr protein kinase RdoA (MazF antagonist)